MDTKEFKDEDYKEALTKSFIQWDKNLATKSTKKELRALREKYPEGNNKFLELLGLHEELEKGNQDMGTDKIFDSIGCTANVLLIHDGLYYWANAGDSRWVISQRGRAYDLSEDHKPENRIEYERIIKAGSSVIEGRVDGNLNLSRSIGDLNHKQKKLPVEKQPITCVPEVRTRTVDEDDDFIIMAWDGVWEVKNSQEVVDFVDERLSNEMSIDDIVKELLDEVWSDDWMKDQNLGCDNMTWIIINIKR